MFSDAVVWLIKLVPQQLRLVTVLAVLGLAIGSTVAFFTDWVVIPLAILVVPAIFYALGVMGFWGWLYYTVETWGEKK